MKAHIVTGFAAATLLACGPDAGPSEVQPAGGIATAELTGVDGTRDSADQACNVVLRTMTRRTNDHGGYLEDSQYRWLWFATIDVSAAAVAEGAVPALLYQVGSDRNWYSIDATLVTSGPTYSRYEAAPGLIHEGISGTGITRTHILAIPYLRLAGGGRLFDHNRVRDPGASYDLSWSNGELTIQDDAAICPLPAPPSVLNASHTATLAFALDGSVTQSGALLAGSELRVDYDIGRLPTCRNTHNGFPAWDLVAHARFLPSGATVQGSVRAFWASFGVPTAQGYSVPFQTHIPAGTTSVELWFENTSGAGSQCVAWDSVGGENYRYSTLPPVGWIGEPSVIFSRSLFGCDGGSALSTEFHFDTWVRQRAAVKNICFQVWQPGTTDRDNPNLWREINVEAHYRFSPDQPWRSTFVGQLDRVGNNARYRFDANALDPFRWGAPCENTPTTVTADGQYDRARMELYFTANGVILSAPGDQPFIGLFDDYRGTLSGRCP